MTRAPDTLLTEFAPSRQVVVEWTGIGTGAGLVATFVFAGLYAAWTGTTVVEFGTLDLGSTLLTLGLAVGLIAATIVLHEWLHALVIRAYGGDASFGVGVAQFVLPYAYVTTEKRLRRDQFIAVALAPLVVITVLGVPLMLALERPLLVIPLAFNVAGAIGDLWMVGLLRRYPPHVVVEDATSGLRVYGSPDDEPLPPKPAWALARRTALGAGVGFGLLVLAFMTAPVVLDVLGVSSVAVGVPGSVWSVFYFEGGPDGFESGFNPLGLLAVSLLLGFAFALLTAPRRPAG